MYKERTIAIEEREDDTILVSVKQGDRPLKSVLIPHNKSFRKDSILAVKEALKNYGYAEGDVVDVEIEDNENDTILVAYAVIKKRERVHGGNFVYSLKFLPSEDDDDLCLDEFEEELYTDNHIKYKLHPDLLQEFGIMNEEEYDDEYDDEDEDDEGTLSEEEVAMRDALLSD